MNNYMGPQLYVPSSSPATMLRRASSATSTRKRSLTANAQGSDPARLSFASRKSESDKDLLSSMVPVGVVFMEQVALDISVTKEHADVRYVMAVHHLKSNTAWKHARSFDEYRKFQHRLLKTLSHGHFCGAECPWLFTFLKSYFPKKNLFHFSTARVVASRKEALQRFFVTLQTFLLNRANHNCSVVANAVVPEVVDFVYGSLAKQFTDAGADNQRNSFIKGGRNSLDGSAPADAIQEDDDTSSSSASSSCATAHCCQLCESSLDGAAYASSRSLLAMPSSSTSLMDEDSVLQEADGNQSFLLPPMSSSAPATCSAISGGGRRVAYYVTTLGCGHQFHDECIVPRLNETLRCPTCDHLEVK